MLLVLAPMTQAAEWQFMGDSEVGKHFLDRTTLIWEQNKTTFSVLTKVTQKNDQEWLLRMQVDCKLNSYTYVNGTKSVKGEVVLKFDTPKPTETILADTVPDQLKREYCEAPNQASTQWELVGKSAIADVYFDPSSLRYSNEANLFIVETRVQPFDQSGETLSRLSFNCDNHTFSVLRMSKFKDGKIENLFEKPQAAAPTNKTATLDKLADRFCSTIKQMDADPAESGSQQTVCDQTLAELQAIEDQVQTDIDTDNLKCKRNQSYLKQLDVLNKVIRRNSCPVGDLADYMKSIKALDCKK